MGTVIVMMTGGEAGMGLAVFKKSRVFGANA
jgi:hypothetical protein